MIKCFTFDNFKSFEKAELNIETLTTLIGTNSSGKSNAIEGIAILAMASTGIDLSTILDGTKNTGAVVRGGSHGSSRFKTSAFKLGCLIDWDEDNDSILQGGTEAYNNGHHMPIIYGDYYFIEAIWKLCDKEMFIW